MSIVTVHGPNTMFGSGATGGGSGPVTENAQIKVTASMTNGYVFTVEAVNKQRPAADYDWVTTGATTPTKADTKDPFTVTYTSAGLKTISLTIAAGAGPPAGGTYNITVQAVSGPRSVEDEVTELPPTDEVTEEVPVGFDPAAHTVAEVQEYVTEHPDQANEMLDAEVAGKNRSTLVIWLQEQIPYDPGDYTIQEVQDYVMANPEERDEVWALESNGKNRITLINWLESFAP